MAKEVSLISRRSKFFFANTMVCLIQALEGKHITVEIRNGFVIKGKLLSVNSEMGLTLCRVVLTNVKGQSQQLDHFYLQGRNILYVHIPDEVNIIEAMTWQLNKADFFQKKERENTKRLFDKKKERSEARYQRQNNQRGNAARGRGRGRPQHHH